MDVICRRYSWCFNTAELKGLITQVPAWFQTWIAHMSDFFQLCSFGQVCLFNQPVWFLAFTCFLTTTKRELLLFLSFSESNPFLCWAVTLHCLNKQLEVHGLKKKKGKYKRTTCEGRGKMVAADGKLEANTVSDMLCQSVHLSGKRQLMSLLVICFS